MSNYKSTTDLISSLREIFPSEIDLMEFAERIYSRTRNHQRERDKLRTNDKGLNRNLKNRYLNEYSENYIGKLYRKTILYQT